MKLYRSVLALSLLVVIAGLMLWASPQPQTNSQSTAAQTQGPAKTAGKPAMKHHKGGHRAPRNRKDIQINPKDCTVDSDTLRVYKRLGHKIVWEFQEPSPAPGTVKFTKGPTADANTPCEDNRRKSHRSTGRDTFTVPINGTSDKCKVDPKAPEGPYKYVVTVDHGGCTGPDPSVDVQK